MLECPLARSANDNQYAHPIDMVPVVDLNLRKVVHIDRWAAHEHGQRCSKLPSRLMWQAQRTKQWPSARYLGRLQWLQCLMLLALPPPCFTALLVIDCPFGMH